MLRTRLARGGIAAVVGLVAVGCGGDVADTASSTTNGGSSVAATGEPAGTAPSQTTGSDGTQDALDGLEFPVGQSFWHSGYLVTLESGRVEALRDTFDEVTGHVVTITGTFENLGEDTFWFAPEMTIVQGTANFPFNMFGDVPEAGSGLSVSGELEFSVDDSFDPDQAMLLVGDSGQARAEVPLGPGAGELVDLPPTDVDVAGSLSIAQLDLDVTDAQLRWDVPAQHAQVEVGSRALTLSMTATSRKTGNWQVFTDWFFLTGPDGTSMPVDGARLDTLSGSEDGVTVDGQYLRFLVDEDAAGDYTLVMQPADYWIDDGPTEATLDFTLP